MTDDKVSVEFGAQTGELTTGVGQAKSAVEGMKPSVDNLSESFRGLNEIIDLLKLDFLYEQFKKVIEASEQWTSEIRRLSNQFGESTEAASNLDATLKIIGVSAETFASAAMKLDRQIRTNEDGINQLGVVTRDVSTGALLPQQQIMLNAIATLNEYKAGTDRNLAAIMLFGRGVGDLTDLLRLNSDKINENKDFIEGLGLVIDKDGVEASIRFKEEMGRLELVFISIKKQIAEEVLPELIKLAEWFNEGGPLAIGKALKALDEYTQALGALYAMIASHQDPELAAAVDEEIANRATGQSGTATLPQTTTSSVQEGTRTFDDSLLKGDASAAKAAQKEREQLAREDVSFEEQMGRLSIANEKTILDEKVALGEITNKEKYDQLNKLLDDEYNLENEALLKESQLTGLSVVDQQKIDDQMLLLHQKYLNQKDALTRKSLQEEKQQYDQIFQGINRAFTTSINGILMGTQTWRQATANIFTGILSVFVDMAEKMVAKWLESMAMQAIFGKTEGAGQIANSAAEAGAAAYASTAAIPIIGPELAPEAAAAAYADTMAFQGGLASFDVGAWELPGDQIARVHKGETIIPKTFADGLRENGSLGGGGDTYHIHAVDAQSFVNMLKSNASAITKIVGKATRNFSPDVPAWKAG